MAEFPEAREAIFQLIDGTTHAGRTVSAFYVLNMGWESDVPVAQIYVQRGGESHLDRTDWVVVNVFAAPGEAIPVAESIRASLANRPHDVPGVGFIDNIHVEQTPQDVPYPSDRVMQAQMILRVTCRPS